MCVRACVYQKTYVSTGINIVEMPFNEVTVLIYYCLLYTSDAADEDSSV